MSEKGRKILRQWKYLCYRGLPVKAYLYLQYLVRYKRRPSFSTPQRFSEKMYCLKLINEKLYKTLLQRCYDKFDVRGYVVEKLGEDEGNSILNRVYGVYEDAAEIDFDALPEKIVLKVTQSSGSNIICRNKKDLDIAHATSQLNKWLNVAKKASTKSEEGSMYTGRAKILCEEYLENSSGEIPPDIRVYCFNGAPKLFVCDFGTTDERGEHGEHIVRNVYDLNWNLIDVNLGRPHDEDVVMERPDNLERIVEIAKKLAEDFLFVRVDLYDVDGRLIFGELTWIPMGGNCVIEPDRYDYLMGSWLSIPELSV